MAIVDHITIRERSIRRKPWSGRTCVWIMASGHSPPMQSRWAFHLRPRFARATSAE